MARTLIAVAAAAIAAVSVVCFVFEGILSGPWSFLLIAALAVFIPSSACFSRRLMINGAFVLGLLPVLWWIRIPPIATFGRVGALLALGVALVVFSLVRGGKLRSKILPTLRTVDSVPVLAAIGLSWLFWPFFTMRAGSNALALLTGGFGGDNVGHSDMFTMIRRSFVEGPGWGTPTDGSTFAYVYYPQHFHALAAAVAEAWAGVIPHSRISEVGLFGLSSAIVVIAAAVTLSAAVVSSSALNKYPWIAAGVALAAVVFVTIGFGATNLTSGFPGFLLAIVGSTLALIAGLERRSSFFTVAVAGSMLLLVAHSWFLLAPIPGLALAFLCLRYWRSRFRGKKSETICLIVFVVGIAIAVAYSFYLVVNATGDSGTAVADALATPGGVVAIPVAVSLGITGAVVLLGAFRVWLAWRNPIRAGIAVSISLTLIASAAVIEGVILSAMQFVRTHHLSYFQYKYFNGIALIFAVVLLVMAAEFLVGSQRFGRGLLRIGAISILVVASVAFLVASSFQSGGQLPGLAFRSNLIASAVSDLPQARALQNAASVMTRWPCVRPFYLTATPSVMSYAEANQWAMSLSGTWTERGSAITGALLSHPAKNGTQATTLLESVLVADAQNCAIVAPATRAALPQVFLGQFGDRIFTW